MFDNKYLDKNVRDYVDNLDKISLTEKEEEELFLRYSNGDISARNKLIEKNLMLVVNIVNTYCDNDNENIMDLIQSGNIGLIKVIDNYYCNCNNSKSFKEVAITYIKQKVFEELIRQKHFIKISIELYEKIEKYKKMVIQLRKKHGKSLTIDIIASELNTNIKNVERLILLSKNMVSLDDNVYLNSSYSELIPNYRNIIFELNCGLDVQIFETEVKDIISDDIEIIDKIQKQLLEYEVGRALDKSILSDREKMVLIYRFGLNNINYKTFPEIKELLGVSIGRLRKNYDEGIRKLKLSKGSIEILKDYY